MAFYIAALVHVLSPAILTAVLWFTAMGEAGAPRRTWPTGALACGVMVGALAAVFDDVLSTGETAVGAILHGASFLAASLALLLLVLSLPFVGQLARSAVGRAMVRLRYSYGAALAAVLVALGVFDVYGRAIAHGLTATNVVNTDLVLNCAAILIGLAMLVVLGVALNRVARNAGGIAARVALILALLITLVAESGEVVQSLLRLEWIGVTAGRISYAAQLSVVDPWFAYADLGLCLALALIAFVRRFRARPIEDRVARRLQTARVLAERHWRGGLFAITGLLLAVLLFQDFYASLPPALSPAIQVRADAGGYVRIPIDQVNDGKLYRFAYASAEGHQVRFFLINRYDAAHVDIGVVFDACKICGDAGYIQRGDEIICVACNVRIFRPSIGKPGGCNPIPLPHEVVKGAIVIAASDLENGASNFTKGATAAAGE